MQVWSFVAGVRTEFMQLERSTLQKGACASCFKESQIIFYKMFQKSANFSIQMQHFQLDVAREIFRTTFLSWKKCFLATPGLALSLS